VYVSALQKPNPAQNSWLMYLQWSIDLDWFLSLCNNLLVLLHASTCQQSLPELDKELLLTEMWWPLLLPGMQYMMAIQRNNVQKMLICFHRCKQLISLFKKKISPWQELLLCQCLPVHF
jgi:hypothetical protein